MDVWMYVNWYLETASQGSSSKHGGKKQPIDMRCEPNKASTESHGNRFPRFSKLKTKANQQIFLQYYSLKLQMIYWMVLVCFSHQNWPAFEFTGTPFLSHAPRS